MARIITAISFLLVAAAVPEPTCSANGVCDKDEASLLQAAVNVNTAAKANERDRQTEVAMTLEKLKVAASTITKVLNAEKQYLTKRTNITTTEVLTVLQDHCLHMSTPKVVNMGYSVHTASSLLYAGVKAAPIQSRPMIRELIVKVEASGSRRIPTAFADIDESVARWTFNAQKRMEAHVSESLETITTQLNAMKEHIAKAEVATMSPAEREAIIERTKKIVSETAKAIERSQKRLVKYSLDQRSEIAVKVNHKIWALEDELWLFDHDTELMTKLANDAQIEFQMEDIHTMKTLVAGLHDEVDLCGTAITDSLKANFGDIVDKTNIALDGAKRACFLLVPPVAAEEEEDPRTNGASRTGGVFAVLSAALFATVVRWL